jgi:hypothetical protein
LDVRNPNAGVRFADTCRNACRSDRLKYKAGYLPVDQDRAVPLTIENGFALPQKEAGCGLAWDKDAVERYRVR